jgi:hypothetical protein
MRRLQSSGRIPIFMDKPCKFDMKSLQKTKTFLHPTETQSLTLGDLIAATYGASGQRGAGKILQLAMAANVIRYSRPQ